DRTPRILWKVNQARRSWRRRQSTRPTVTRRSMAFDPREVTMLRLDDMPSGEASIGALGSELNTSVPEPRKSRVGTGVAFIDTHDRHRLRHPPGDDGVSDLRRLPVL